MQKILVTIDLTKIDKSRIKERVFKDKDGVEQTAKEYQIEVVELSDQKNIKEGDTWIMRKTHFVADAQTKEERADKKPTVYIGSGIQFINKPKSNAQDESNIPF